jgi:cytochrome c oxidase accessory protein FixG
MAAPKNKAPNRDTLTSVNKDGSHFIIHPADADGTFRMYRRLVGYALIAVFIALPWIQINGHPALFINVPGRRFHLFGATLSFQDTWLLFFALTGTAFSLFFITALWGRIWCGWSCPQTVYLEHVYRRVERWIEGDAMARRKLDSAPWSLSKLFKRALKHGIFIILSFLIAHIFLAYFVSLPGLWERMTTAPGEHWTSFVFVFAFSAVLYGNFAWFREQLCIIICPYGRFQSALIDSHSKNVAYDQVRGDPPGKPNDPEAGDCIACRRCVQVCPTGIDIRQGLQLECIGCAACIDACDTVMDKIQKPRGLIRYASEEDLAGRKTKWIRFRTIFYGVMMAIGATVAAFAINSVESINATVTRMPGSPYYLSDTTIRNQYQIRLINKSDNSVEFQIETQVSPDLPEISTTGVDQSFDVEPLGESTATFIVQVKLADFEGNFPLQIIAREPGKDIKIIREVEFLGPDAQLIKAK